MDTTSAPRHWFEQVIFWSNWLGSIWIFVMMLIVMLDITMRFAGAPVSGPKEVIEASIVIILYMQIAHTLKAGRLTRSDAFYSRIMQASPAIGHSLGVLFALAGAFLMIAIMWEGWSKWLQSYYGGFFIGAAGVFTVPEWPVRLILFVGCGFVCIQFLLMAADEIRSMRSAKPAHRE